MPKNYPISARIDAQSFISVVADLIRREVPFASLGDVVDFLCTDYLATHGLEPLTLDQTVCAMQDMGLSTNRLKAFKPGRAGFNGLSRAAQTALDKLMAESPIEHSCPSVDPNQEEDIPDV